MQFFATNKCRAIVLCGTLFALGGITEKLNAQEGQVSSQSDVRVFDSFLDTHADVDAQLRANPSLLTNAEYLEAHPQLQAFLEQHPQVETQIRQNPSFFMERAKRFDSNEAARRANPNPDLTRQQVGTMDQFLDKNPDVDRDLRRNPSLVNNVEYLEAHPQLQAFLNQHPNVKEEIAENPRYFMQRENRFDQQERGRGQNPNPDLTRQQVATMDQFLDSHPDIDKTLQRNPWLIRNAEYLKEHPELQTFLNQHPQIRAESAETPDYLMRRETRFDQQERGRGQNPNPDLTRQQVATMDQFLDSHSDIDKTLQRNPWLIRNAEYLKEHPELQKFLNQHPEIKEESAETPKYLMQRETRYDAREASRPDRDDRDANNVRRDQDFNRDRDRDVNGDRDANLSRDFDRRSNPDRSNPDVNNQEVASLDQFLDRHQDIAKSLEKKPELVNDRGYLKRHKDLDEFLSEHPAVREEVRENPSSFMRRENQYEARNMDRDRNVPDRDRDRAADRNVDRGRVSDRDRDVDADLNKKELQDMDRFLDKHKNIDKDLQKNPSLVNDHDYLKHHKPLESFLSKNPQVGEEIREHPSAFMQKEARLQERNHRMNNRQPATKPKTKVEEKEQMHTATPH